MSRSFSEDQHPNTFGALNMATDTTTGSAPPTGAASTALKVGDVVLRHDNAWTDVHVGLVISGKSLLRQVKEGVLNWQEEGLGAVFRVGHRPSDVTS